MRVDQFSMVFAELRASSHVQIHTLHDQLTTYSDDIIQAVRNEIRRRAGLDVNPDLLASLSVSDGAGTYWSYRIDNRFRGAGEFKLRSLREVFLHEPDPLWSDDTPAVEREFLRKLRFFDYRPGAGDNKFAAFALEPGVMPPKIWYYDRGQTHRMTLDYEQYLRTLTETKGITDWQYLFCDVAWETPELRGLDQRLAQSLDALAIMFPNRDYGRYYARLPRGRSG